MEKNRFVRLLESVPELSVSEALETLGGSESVYERVVRLAISLLPENISRLEKLVEFDLPGYAIEVHGLKGVLNNIGAFSLGKRALLLENASKRGDAYICLENNAAFMSELREFYSAVMGIVKETVVSDKPPGDSSLIPGMLSGLREALEFYDSIRALDILNLASDYAFGKNIDEAISELKKAFERFDFDNAQVLIESLDREVTG